MPVGGCILQAPWTRGTGALVLQTMDDILAELPTLVRLAQTGSVNRTAREMGVPRSTISRRLARLEEALGVTLAERTTRSFRLTEQGKTLADAAVKAIAELRTVRESVEHAGGAVRGWLRVSTPPGFGGSVLGRFMVHLNERFPEVRVELTVHEHPPHLLDEGFDLVFAMGPLEDAPWMRHLIGPMWWVPVAHRSYLDRRGRPADIDDLRQHDLLCARTASLRADAWPLLDGGGLRVNPRFVSADLAAVAESARAGMGVALLPIHIVGEDLLRGTMETVLADRVGRHVDVFLLYTPERRASPLIRAVVDTIDDFGRILLTELPPR